MKCSVEELIVRLFVSCVMVWINSNLYLNTTDSFPSFLFALATILGLLSFVFVYPWWKKDNERVY